MNKLLRIAPLVLAAALATACKKPETSAAKMAEAQQPPKAKAEEVKVTNIDFNYLSAKGRIHLHDKDRKVSATVDMRLKKDSAIWMSVRAMGIEGMRLLMTQDSVFVIDRMNNDKLALSFDSLARRLNLNVNFQLAQAALVGNLPFAPGPDTQIGSDSAAWRLQHQAGRIAAEGHVQKNNQKLARMQLRETGTDNRVEIQYADFANAGSQLFPYKTLTAIHYLLNGTPGALQIELNHQKVELSNEPLRFPFTK